MTDIRNMVTEQELAQWALMITSNEEDIKNLSGIILSWAMKLSRGVFTDTMKHNAHPVTLLLIDKLVKLSGYTGTEKQLTDAKALVTAIADGKLTLREAKE